MSRRSLCIVLVGFGLVTWSRAAAAQPPADSRAKMPTAAELVQGIIDAENKVQEVDSLYLRFEGKWTHSAESIAEGRKELQKQFPNEVIDEKRHSNLWPEMTEELELAFDGERLRQFAHWHEFYRALQVFDGQRATSHSQYITKAREHYGLNPQPDELAQHLFTGLSWLRVGAPRFWFSPRQFSKADRERINGYPKDYVHVGQEILRDRNCYVLENRQAHRRLYVGVDDRQLHQIIFYSHPQTVDISAPYEKAAGRTFAKPSDRAKWIQSLTQAEQLAFHERFRREVFSLVRPSAVHFLDDYREIAPGLSMPAKQGYSILNYEDGKPTVSRELQLVEARVNQPLDDELFQMEMKDGVEVADLTHDPPLFYKSKADRTPAEFQAIIDEHRKQNEAWQKQNAARDALVGEPAPQLPAENWLNSDKLDWPALKGKVVLLDFWATTCGPCLNDLPHVESLHKERESSGIVTIGVHAAGTEPAEVAKFAQDHELSYPIVIDAPPASGRGFGKLFKGLSVNAIPYTFLIDRDGRIAAHGSLHDVSTKARQLAATPNNKTSAAQE